MTSQNSTDDNTKNIIPFLLYNIKCDNIGEVTKTLFESKIVSENLELLDLFDLGGVEVVAKTLQRVAQHRVIRQLVAIPQHNRAHRQLRCNIKGGSH